MSAPELVAQFVVEGEPKAQARPRAFARKLKNGKTVARVYGAGTAEAWKTAIAAAARAHRPKEPLTGAVALRVEFRMKRPKAHYGTGRNAGKLKASAPAFHAVKPDRNNLVKAVEDAMTHIGFWRDDAQVASIDATKIYEPAGFPKFEGQRAGVTVRVLKLEE